MHLKHFDIIYLWKLRRWLSLLERSPLMLRVAVRIPAPTDIDSSTAKRSAADVKVTDPQR